MIANTPLMVERLRQLQAISPSIEGAAVVSVDGLIMASAMPANFDEDRVAAMSASLLSLSERFSTELERGDLERVYISGTNGIILLMAVGKSAVLAILSRSNAKLGLLFLDAKQAAQDLNRIIDG